MPARGDPPGEPFPAVLELSSLDGIIGFRVDGDRQTLTGFSVASAGDINGDGLDDLVVGAPGALVSLGLDTGQTYVVFGRRTATGPGFPPIISPSSLDGINGFRLLGVSAGDSSARCVAPAGDVNGDGVGDLLIGAPRADPGGRSEAGVTYVVFGRATTTGPGFPASISLSALNGGDGFRLDGIRARDYSGQNVASAGDVNGDGVDDILVGASGADPSGMESAGQTYVVFGRDTSSGPGFPAVVALSSLNGANGFRLDGFDRLDFSGSSVAPAGDVNGDGVDDVIVGAPGADEGQGYAGETYVVFGRDTTTGPGFPPSMWLSGLNGANGFRLRGTDWREESGISVASAGDVNGDGISDVIVGALFSSRSASDAGSTYVVFGRDTTAGPAFPASLLLSDLDGISGFRIDGAAASDLSGAAVAPAGDVNGDGLRDILIGASNADPTGRDRAGSAFVVFGRDTTTGPGFPAAVALAGLDGSTGFRLNGIKPGDYGGQSVATAGDINGDGVDDLVIGAPRADPARLFDAGQAYVVFGRAKPACTADLNGDGLVDFSDYLEFLNLFDASDPRADFNHDGIVDFSDYLEFLNHFDAGC